MMTKRLIQQVLTFMFIYLVAKKALVSGRTSPMNRVVYHTFLLKGETVQCYGRCEKGNVGVSGRSGDRTFTMTQCEGRKLRYNCSSGYQINIHSAIIGRLNPDRDICSHKQNLECAQNMTTKLRGTCISAQQCEFDVMNEPIRTRCGNVKYLSMDIRYRCVLKGFDNVVRTTRAYIIPITTSTYATVKNNVQLTNNYSMQVFKENNMFWSFTAYTIICTNEFIRINKTQLIMVLLLSIFCGISLWACCFFKYCKWTIKKGNIRLAKCLVKCLVTESDQREKEGKSVEIVELQGNVPKHEMASGIDRDCNDNTIDHRESRCDVYTTISEPRPVRKESMEHKLLIHNDSEGKRLSSSSSLPHPEVHILHDRAALIEDEDNASCLLSGSFTPNSTSTNDGRDNGETAENYDSDLIGIKEAFLEKDCLKGCGHVEMEKYHASDAGSSSPQAPHVTTHHRTGNYEIPSRSKTQGTSATSNDETSLDDIASTDLESKRMRMRKFISSDRDRIPKGKRTYESDGNPRFPYNDNHYSVTKSRGMQIDTTPRCQKYTRVQRVTHSDNETSRRKYRDVSGDKRACNCREVGTSLLYSHIRPCKHDDVDNHFRRLSMSSNRCESIGGEQYTNDDNAFVSSCSKRVDINKCAIEESGYQSRGTTTDSLCSSAFSTDEDDGRVFAPLSDNRSLHKLCHSKSCNIHTKSTRHVRGCDKSETQRGYCDHKATAVDNVQRRGIANCGHRHHNFNSLDRADRKRLRRTRRPSLSGTILIDLEEEKHCNFID